MQLEARLRAFSAFALRRSFSAAANELRISQPAVSKHIADLEQALGVKLVELSLSQIPSAWREGPNRVMNARCGTCST
jgi:DNA-binding Lrp family transcriptional regulator